MANKFRESRRASCISGSDLVFRFEEGQRKGKEMVGDQEKRIVFPSETGPCILAQSEYPRERILLIS